jgi:hypothetical protein
MPTVRVPVPRDAPEWGRSGERDCGLRRGLKLAAIRTQQAMELHLPEAIGERRRVAF